ncbi:DUF3309 family protein [Nocardia seriolae]|uniref:Uncharacterized protein n=1 Tax=Nocardia seriolae TaxID=37332 RepID=A0A0B8NAJ2_9NOCA|nr:DUF3309 family protein [Nocardia seriolae]APA99266.1 hypothetical protein NS506_05220 [Nocardia seriolae]MTJ63339.1 DUF3309 family protein [Nocardia seriolae]MTJ71216.1 DUF3309 family protein [Nocardia seriolae]MTJ88859.1 DUF3309 family protein [Nocardia seriolae]MTK32841.1 DUF3309 family protein [Nocardia seriolae]
MKRLLFVVIALIAAGSTFDYARTAGHYGPAVVVGVIVTLLLVVQAMK